jgi:PilZ domain
MLQMHCPNCKVLIKSPFLAEVSTIECYQCKENIPVKDVYITTKNFTMHREDFLNRSFRFQKFLREVEKERFLMANSKSVSTKSLESIEQIYSSLQELLAGARNSYRMEITCDLLAEVDYDNKITKGRVLNLSTEGASIKLVAFDNTPKKKSELKVNFSIPEFSEKLCTHAKVVWTKEQIGDHKSESSIIGVTFIDIDEHTHSCIWNYIVNNTPAPFQRASR